MNLHPLASTAPILGVFRLEGPPPRAWMAGRSSRDADRGGGAGRPDGSPGDDDDCRASIRAVVETQIIPRLLHAHRRDGAVVQGLTGPPVRPEDVIELARLCAAGELAAAIRAVELLRAGGLDPERVLLELLGPAAQHLGRLWDDDATSFAEVTLGLGLMHELIHAMGYEFDAGPQQAANVQRVMLASAPGSQHLLGLAIVSEIYRKAGWDVVVEVSTSRAELARAVANEWFDLIGLSVALDTQLPGLPALVGALRESSKNGAVPVLLGGPVFALHTLDAATFGAQAVCTDARDCVPLSQSLLAR